MERAKRADDDGDSRLQAKDANLARVEVLVNSRVRHFGFGVGGGVEKVEFGEKKKRSCF